MANSDDHNKRTETVCHLKNRAQSAVEKLRSLCVRMVEYLDGIFYYERDVPAGSPWIVDPLAGKIGVLDRVAGLASSPGHTAQQSQLAILIDNVIARIRTDLQQVRKDAILLLPMKTDQLRQQSNQALLDEVTNLTSEVTCGWLDHKTGENIGACSGFPRDCNN